MHEGRWGRLHHDSRPNNDMPVIDDKKREDAVSGMVTMIVAAAAAATAAAVAVVLLGGCNRAVIGDGLWGCCRCRHQEATGVCPGG